MVQRHWESKQDGDVEFYLPLKDEAQPIAHKLQRVHYDLTDLLKKQMEKFTEKYITEKIPEHNNNNNNNNNFI